MATAEAPLKADSSRQAPFTGLLYSQCWEDPRTIEAGLSLTPDDDLLIITSGGCNALALSMKKPNSITAVDFDPAQTHLLELKIGAARTLDYATYLSFLGVTPSDVRLSHYRMVREALSGPGQTYWDQRLNDIRTGVIHAGKFERYLNLFRRFALRFAHPRSSIDRLLALTSLEEQEAFYEAEWDNARWRFLFRAFFGRFAQRRLARHPRLFEYAKGDLGTTYLQRVRHGLVEVPIHDNYFVEYMTTGRYRVGPNMPPYLTERGFESTRAHADRIRLVTAEIGTFLGLQPSGAFSAIHLSDIFESMSEAEAFRVFHDLAAVATDGARITYYNNVVHRTHPAELDAVFHEDPAEGERLLFRDRAFVYGRFAVARLTKS